MTPETGPDFSEINPEKSFEDKKRDYCSDFALSHKSIFRPHYSHGETLGSGPEIWRNVSEHCLVSGIFADILSEKMGLSEEDRRKVVAAALLHDWDKKHETLAINELRSNNTLTIEALDELKKAADQELLEIGIDPEIVHLTAANVPASVEGPATLPEQIVWYVDAMMSNTEPVPIAERFDNLLRGWDGSREDPARAERNKAFSDMYADRYDGKSLYEVQAELGQKIGTEFSEKVGYEDDPNDLPLFLRQIFVDRVGGS